MNEPLLIFSSLVILGVAATAWFFRGALFAVSSAAADHAKIYAVAYVKGGALILITAGQALSTAFQLLGASMQASMPWVPYVIFFWQPVSAGLAVLVAFLDRSTQKASEEAANVEAKKQGSRPPFPSAPQGNPPAPNP